MQESCPSSLGGIIKTLTKVTAIALLSVPLIGLTACGDNVDEDGKKRPALATHAPPEDSTSSPKRPFGASPSSIHITPEASKRVSKDAANNAYLDTMNAAQKARESSKIYGKSKKHIDAYESVQSAVTKSAWKDESESLESSYLEPMTAKSQVEAKLEYLNGKPASAKKLRAPILSSLALPCDEYGGVPLYRNLSKKTGDPEFTVLRCKDSYTRLNPRTVIVSPDTNSKDGLIVNVSFIQTFRGEAEVIKANGDVTNMRGNASQEIAQDTRFFLVPDKDKKDHWLIDGASYQYEYGRATREQEVGTHRETSCHGTYPVTCMSHTEYDTPREMQNR